MRLIPYYGFLRKDKVMISGRLVYGKLRKPKITDSVFRNIVDMIKRYFAIGAGSRNIKITFNGKTKTVKTDSKGNYKVSFDTVKLKGEESYTVSYKEETRSNTVFLPEKENIAIVTDIDDTFLVTHSVSFFRRIWVNLSKNYHMRNPVQDIINIYKSFSVPIFYVSNSQWRLYDVLDGFRKIHDLPHGPLLLRGRSKYERINSLLESYPYDLILIGDDSQKDPEEYSRLKNDYPKRIAAVCIRHISSDKRLDEVKKMLHDECCLVSADGKDCLEFIKKKLSKRSTN